MKEMVWTFSILKSNFNIHTTPIFFKDFIYLFLHRGEGWEKQREKISMCGCLLHAPYWGPGLNPRHVPWLGIELATLGFAGQHSIHWATPARAIWLKFIMSWNLYIFAVEWHSTVVKSLSKGLPMCGSHCTFLFLTHWSYGHFTPLPVWGLEDW